MPTTGERRGLGAARGGPAAASPAGADGRRGAAAAFAGSGAPLRAAVLGVACPAASIGKVGFAPLRWVLG